jgi:hypothetical protein
MEKMRSDTAFVIKWLFCRSAVLAAITIPLKAVGIANYGWVTATSPFWIFGLEILVLLAIFLIYD